MVPGFTTDTIKSVKAEHGTKPDKTFWVLENSVHPLIWNAFFDSDMFETKIGLCKNELHRIEEGRTNYRETPFHPLKLKNSE